MTEHAADERSWRSEQDPYTRRQSGWVGWVVFGAMMILFLGAWHVFLGVVSLWREEIFVTGRNEMPVDVSYTDWGWVHITVGVFALVVGACVLRGYLWARLVGVWFAFLSAFVNLAFLPAYPIWSALMIAIDVIVMWALVVHGGELRREPLDDEL
jgi:hypothetical protein